MISQELYLGLGSAAYALAKADGRLQSAETETLRLILLHEPQADVTLQAFDVQEQYNVSVEEAYQYAFRRFESSRQHLDEETKKQFIRVMERIAQAYDGVSRKENELLRRFRRDLNRL